MAAATENPMAASAAAIGDLYTDNETAERFSHLLQPIRDLAENWNIDVARELEDYLEELESLTISIPDGNRNLNFAEAALLIQGSACIYSRKVEYLYNLIFKTLETLSHQKKREKRPASTLEEEEADLLYDAREQFLLLDDVVKESSNVDMKEDRSIYENIAVAASTDPRKTPKAPGTHQNLINKTPLSMMATQGGDTAGHQTFRLASTSIHQSGALLPEPSYAELLTHQQPRQPNRLSSASSLSGLATGNLFEGRSADQQYASVEDLRNGNDDDDESMGGFEDMGDEQMDFSQGVNDAPIVQNQPRQARSSHEEHTQVYSVDTTFNHKPADDPWEELDPYDTSVNRNLKPLKSGKTFEAPKNAESIAKEGMEISLLRSTARKRALGKFKQEPASLSDVTENCESLSVTEMRKKIEALDDDALWKISNISDTEVDQAASVFSILGYEHGSHSSKKWSTADFPEVSGHPSPFFSTLKHQFAAHQKLKKSFRLKNMKRQQNNNREKDLESLPEEEYGDDGPDNDDFGVFDDDELDGVGDNLQIADHEYADDQESSGNNIDRSLASTTELNGTTVTYEELVREHINKYIKGAENRIQDSNLNQAVNDWRGRIQPMLELERERPEFDIYECGDTVLHKFEHINLEEKNTGSTYNFEDVTKGCERYEVCRMFLATLQLANEGAVDFVDKERDEDPTEASVSSNLKVELLSANRHFESSQGFSSRSASASATDANENSSAQLDRDEQQEDPSSKKKTRQKRKEIEPKGKENSRRTRAKVEPQESATRPTRSTRSQPVEYTGL